MFSQKGRTDLDLTLVGGGYVGVATAIGFGHHGHRVTIVERDPRIIAALRSGTPPFHEPGLDEALSEAVDAGWLHTTEDLETAVRTSSVVFLCVGTPPGEDGAVDLSQIIGAARQVAEVDCDDDGRRTLVVKSTVPPGTTENMVAPVFDHSQSNWGLAVNPEFLREGQALDDSLNPDRIVLGACDPESAATLDELYAGFDAPLLHLSPTTAEMIKYTSNALLATMISFSNEIGDICERLPGVSAVEVFRALHLDRRLSPEFDGERITAGIASYLLPGCGYGGSCLPKDLSALINFAENQGVESLITDATRRINESRPRRLVDQAVQRLNGLEHRKVAVLGLSFKPDTDDMRSSPAIPIVDELLEAKALVRVYDPAGFKNAYEHWGTRSSLHYSESLDDALDSAEAALLVTSWREFRELDPTRVASLMNRPLVLDGRGMLQESARDFLEYWCIGDGPPE